MVWKKFFFHKSKYLGNSGTTKTKFFLSRENLCGSYDQTFYSEGSYLADKDVKHNKNKIKSEMCFFGFSQVDSNVYY